MSSANGEAVVLEVLPPLSVEFAEYAKHKLRELALAEVGDCNFLQDTGWLAMIADAETREHLRRANAFRQTCTDRRAWSEWLAREVAQYRVNVRREIVELTSGPDVVERFPEMEEISRAREERARENADRQAREQYAQAVRRENERAEQRVHQAQEEERRVRAAREMDRADQQQHQRAQVDGTHCQQVYRPRVPLVKDENRIPWKRRWCIPRDTAVRYARRDPMQVMRMDFCPISPLHRRYNIARSEIVPSIAGERFLSDVKFQLNALEQAFLNACYSIRNNVQR